MDAATSLQSIGDIAVSQSVLGAAGISLGAKKLSGAAIDKTAGDFEGMFMTQMLQPMFEGVGNDPVFGGGHGEEVMKSFMIQEYGKIVAKGGHLGIAAAVKKEMILAQAKAGGASASTSASDGGTNVPVVQ